MDFWLKVRGGLTNGCTLIAETARQQVSLPVMQKMKPNIQIRKARPEDNDEVTAFAFEIMRSLGVEPKPENIDYALATFGKEREIHSNDFVAVYGELLVGSVILKTITPSIAEMTGFYVRTDFRGQGVGRELIKTALSTAIETGYEQVVLTTNRNMTAAISLYESFGWVKQHMKPDNGADYLYSLSL